MKIIPYGRQSISQEDIDCVVETLKSDYLTQGPKVVEFEKNFAKYVKAKYAVAVSNGTAALHLCALALDIKSGDKVITTPITFVASANGFRYCGAEITFCDINEKNYLLDLVKLEAILKSKPKNYYKAIIPVDFAGYPIHAEKLRQLADEYGCKIVEDACHAPGAYFTNNKGEIHPSGNGAYSDLTVFSFHPVKHIATGEGGMITTNDKALYEKLISLRTHGITKNPDLLEENHGGWYYEMQELGYNYRLSDIQAALGVSQLKKAENNIIRRNEIATKYDSAFLHSNKITTPYREKAIQHAFHLYIIQIEDRKGLYEHLRAHNIFSQVLYIPAHYMPYYKKLGWKKGDMPVAEAYYEKCLALPMYPSLLEEEQNFVIEKVLEFIG